MLGSNAISFKQLFYICQTDAMGTYVTVVCQTELQIITLDGINVFVWDVKCVIKFEANRI